ncbi:SdpI family protein [Sphingomonas morindae]|uniref:SdpI family protein n=1 Tax=Sphingomonas morindae TaxID=1541170 RepID=A0ABY4X6E4_9SPHN|nr:SdpI family protein [Sphingomonas morindae]USI72487.1 SdpI family protein [Sphingomonas morindae]
MRYRAHIVASVVIVLALAGLAAAALSWLPPGARLPTHWAADGRPDRSAGAVFALFGPVVLTALLAAAMAAIPYIEPMQHRLEASAPLYRTAWSGLLAMMAVVELMVAAGAFGIALPGGTLLVALGLFLILLGNALPKSRPGFFVGIRTPWTLHDEANWIATHRYAARIMIAGGAALIMLALAPIDPGARTALVRATLLVIAANPVIYSFFFWRRIRNA